RDGAYGTRVRGTGGDQSRSGLLCDHGLRVGRTAGSPGRPRPQLPGAQRGTILDAASRRRSRYPRASGGRSGRRTGSRLFDQRRACDPCANWTRQSDGGVDDRSDAELDRLTAGGSPSRPTRPPAHRRTALLPRLYGGGRIPDGRRARVRLLGGVLPRDRPRGLERPAIRSGGDRGGPGDAGPGHARRMGGPVWCLGCLRGARAPTRGVGVGLRRRRRPPQSMRRQLILVLSNAGDRSEEAVLLLADTGREVKRVGGRERSAARAAVAEADPPQTIDLDRGAGLVPKGSDEAPGPGAVGVDVSVAEVANQQRPAEGPEVFGCDREPPRRVQLSVPDEPPQGVAVLVEDVDEAEAGAGLVIMLVRLLHRVGHVQPATQRLDVEGRETGGDSRIREGAAQGHEIEVLVEDLNGAEPEISGVEVVRRAVVADRQPFEYGALADL